MARIEWSRLAAEDVEHLVGVLLCRENAAAKRVRPSRGDGGIDIFVPVPEKPGTVHVFQVKCFATNLTASQKGQVERSFRRVRDFAQESGWQIGAWYLTLPLDATHENLAWLAEITVESDFDCDWRGLTFLDGLAAAYPEVVDYYLHDGADRLAMTVKALSEGLGLLRRSEESDGAAGLLAGDVTTGLAALHEALNAQDPHYRYDFSVDAVPADLTDQPGLVVAVQRSDDQRCVTVRVFARYAEAVLDRPVPLHVTVEAEPGSDLAQQLADFEKFGTPLEAPSGTVTGEADLPGGLGGSLDGGSLTIGPSSSSEKGHDMRIQVLAENDEVLAETLVHMQPPSTGFSRTGVRVLGEEQYGTFGMEIRADFSAGQMTLELTSSMARLTGVPPAHLLPGLRVVMNYHPPHRVRFAAPFGPVTHEAMAITEESDLVRDAGRVYDVAEALATIQEHTPVQITMPDLTSVSTQTLRDWGDAARLLRGETLAVPWEALQVHLHPGVRPDVTEPFTVLTRDQLTVLIGEERVELGVRQIHLPAVRVDPDAFAEHDDHLDVTLRPAGGSEATLRYIGRETSVAA